MARARLPRLFFLPLVALALPAGLLLAGCTTPGPGRYNVEVSVDPAWQAEGVNKSVTVDLIGVSPAEYGRWESVSMNAYADSQLRKDFESSIRSYDFSPRDASTKTLAKEDEIWTQWLDRGAAHLFVLADIPGVDPASDTGGAGARRLILPLKTSCWETDTIALQLKEGSIVTLTPQVPGCEE